MIARMNDRAKNHTLFLRAAARVASRFPLAEFVLVGDGLSAMNGRSWRGNSVSGSQTRFWGSDMTLPSVLAALDVVVSPSRSESLSNSILEAMAAARPVIATRGWG